MAPTETSIGSTPFVNMKLSSLRTAQTNVSAVVGGITRHPFSTQLRTAATKSAYLDVQGSLRARQLREVLQVFPGSLDDVSAHVSHLTHTVRRDREPAADHRDWTGGSAGKRMGGDEHENVGKKKQQKQAAVDRIEEPVVSIIWHSFCLQSSWYDSPH